MASLLLLAAPASGQEPAGGDDEDCDSAARCYDLAHEAADVPDGGAPVPHRRLALLIRACELGLPAGCEEAASEAVAAGRLRLAASLREKLIELRARSGESEARAPSLVPSVSPGTADAAAPRGYHYETVRRQDLLILGGIIFGAAYLFSAGLGISAGVNSGNAFHYLWALPIAGPPIGQVNYGLHQSPGSGPGCGMGGICAAPSYNSTLDWVGAAVGSAVQLLGLLLLLVGLEPMRKLVPDREE
jgi:hypothetical protein